MTISATSWAGLASLSVLCYSSWVGSFRGNLVIYLTRNVASGHVGNSSNGFCFWGNIFTVDTCRLGLGDPGEIQVALAGTIYCKSFRPL